MTDLLDPADPLNIYEGRAIEAAEMLDAAAAKLEATPDHEKAQTMHAAAQRLAALTAAQSTEACARHTVTSAAARLAAWRGHRRVYLARNVALVAWAPMVAAAVLAVWVLALGLILVGIAVFIVTIVVTRGCDRIAREAGQAITSVGGGLGEAAWTIGLRAVGPLRRGSRADLAERRAACEAASERHEEATLALIAAERGMPYTAVYPLAELDTPTAERIELAVYAELREWRAREAARAAERRAAEQSA